ncbi:hypothetical protein VNO77_50424 [Canavalia gladiata]|uniref:Uncharacterized protein n=1 Tax=Canavalia gladiata TaxID=3824 RepID=A0AAN9JFH6_CANGL
MKQNHLSTPSGASSKERRRESIEWNVGSELTGRNACALARAVTSGVSSADEASKGRRLKIHSCTEPLTRQVDRQQAQLDLLIYDASFFHMSGSLIFVSELKPLPFSERLYPGREREGEGQASKKKQKDSQSSRDSSRRQVLQRKLSIQREDRVVVVNRGREQLIRQDGIPLLHVFGLSFSCVDASKAAPSPPPPSPLPVGYLRGLELRDCLLNVPYLTYRSIR